MNEYQKLLKVLNSEIFENLKHKASDYYNNFGEMSLKESYAYGIMKALEWVTYSKEGRDWLFDEHPILTNPSSSLFEYTGSQVLAPTHPEIPAKYLMIINGRQRKPAKESNIYIYTGTSSLSKSEIRSITEISVSPRPTFICSNKDCENKTAPKWCVSDHDGTLLCNYCAGGQNKPGANTNFCRKHKEACIEQGCSYAQAYLPMRAEV